MIGLLYFEFETGWNITWAQVSRDKAQISQFVFIPAYIVYHGHVWGFIGFKKPWAGRNQNLLIEESGAKMKLHIWKCTQSHYTNKPKK